LTKAIEATEKEMQEVEKNLWAAPFSQENDHVIKTWLFKTGESKVAYALVKSKATQF
jgi:hypothetical protein